MSYILDALKKSEQERSATRDAGSPSAQEIPIVVQYNWPAIGGLLLLLNIVLAILLVWWNKSAATPLPEPTVAIAPASSEPAIDNEPSSTQHAERPLNDLVTPIAAPRAKRASPQPVTVAVAKQSLQQINDAPFLRTLSDSFQHSVPAMTVNIHVYAPQQEQSILYINNRQYHAGEAIGNGAHLEAIVPDGAVLTYNGQAFKLPRPN